MCTFAPQNITAGTDSMKKCVFHIGFLVILMLCSSCVSRGVREAQEVVAQADSLWHDGQMYGIDAGDSATLAQAYETLDKSTAFCRRIREIFPFVQHTSSLGTYSHACYHYGRLLREKDDPVAAMQAFINATHSHTGDYHILGRVYSNMGSICHLAGEFPLSYDMYERCADMYLQNGDTLLYYYGLNNMAFETAMLTDKERTLSIISEIKNSCSDYNALQDKILETKAELYLRCKQYDSAYYYASKSNTFLSELIKAQVCSYKGFKDSSVYYAQQVLMHSKDMADRYNALYILINDDEDKDKNDVRQISAERADTQKLIEKQQVNFSKAVQLLEQDLTRKPDKRWILTLVSFSLFVLVVISLVYIWKKRKMHKYIIQDIRTKEEINSQLSNDIENLTHLQEAHHKEIYTDIEKVCQLLQNSQAIQDHLHWNNYDMMIASANRYLYNIITYLQPFRLSEKETRLCILVLLKASTEQMVDMIPYSHSGIGKFKYTTAHKLGTTTSQMRSFILRLLG